MIKVLLVAAGRRYDLACLFRERNCDIYAYEIDLEVPLADGFKVIQGKKWDDPDFTEHLQSVVDKFKIDLVLSLDCKGVDKLSSLSLLNTNVVCPLRTTAEICLNKKELELQCLYRDELREFYPFPQKGCPAVIKPIFGYGSQGIRYIDSYDGIVDEDDVNYFDPHSEITQYQLIGREYSVDAYFNRNFKLVGASPRKRLWVAGGEVIETITVEDERLINLTKLIGESISCRGPTCFQYIENSEGIPFLTEINHRAGGGSTISIKSGLDFIQVMIDEYIHNKEISPNTLKAIPNVYCCRSFRDHIFYPKE